MGGSQTIIVFGDDAYAAGHEAKFASDQYAPEILLYILAGFPLSLQRGLEGLAGNIIRAQRTVGFTGIQWGDPKNIKYGNNMTEVSNSLPLFVPI
jgi:hypothetical protein